MRRTLIYLRPMTSVLLSAVLVFSLTAFKCGGDKTPEQQKAEFIAYAKDIRDGFVAAGPFIIKLKPGLESQYNMGTSIAGKLISAVEQSNSTEAADLVTELVPIFTEIVDEFTDNTKILATLALANIGLAFFANHYKSATASASARGPVAQSSQKQARAIAFANRKPWKCRASGPVDRYKAGQYIPMTLCTQFPDNTQVETR